MNDEQNRDRSEMDAELEREIREERKFSLSEAIGCLAGPEMMKGTSPITRKQQVEAEIEEYLRREFADVGDALCIVVLRYVKQSKELLDNYDQPLLVLMRCLRSIMNSERLLKECVREADAEWGKNLGERPYFEQESLLPNPADPYTVESVRTRLSGLIEKLPAGA